MPVVLFNIYHDAKHRGTCPAVASENANIESRYMEVNYNHEKFMKKAIEQAKKAEALGEVPIGCVIVRDGKIIARGYNRRKTTKNTLSHAELIAIDKACRKTGDWRLEDCVLYVTLEPCQMCAGAIVQARIPLVVQGCRNEKAGCAGSILNLFNVDKFNHTVELIEGVLEEECSTMLTSFFKSLRQRLKYEKESE